jgi:hypothetical protein
MAARGTRSVSPLRFVVWNVVVVPAAKYTTNSLTGDAVPTKLHGVCGRCRLGLIAGTAAVRG